jgi:tRNA (cytidine/uridine-2'-O-)-methyltransferase
MHIVLVEPEIPANTGNIARLCAATQSTLHLIHPLGFRLADSEMRRAGMDYLDIAAIKEHLNLQDCLKEAKTFYYLTTKSKNPYWKVKFGPDDYLIFGRESKGLPEELLKANPDKCLTIPMIEPKARSLNLSTSVGIVLYESIRQISVNS